MSEPLSRLAVRGVLWQALSFGLGRGLTLVTTIVLARLLTPEEFGLVGLALVFVAFAEYVTDLGVAQAVIYLDRDRRTRDTALSLCLLSGTVLAVAALLAAPAIADFFDAADVEPMVRVLSLALLLSAVRQVPVALLRRELAFRPILISEIARALAQGVVSIALAAAGEGAWAIVWGYVAGSAVGTVVAWVVCDDRPGVGFSRPAARRLLAFGAPAAAQALLAALIFDIDYLIVGSVLGAEALGLYTLAFRLPQVAIIGVFGVLSAVAFPAFSRARSEPARLKRGFLTGLRLQSAYGVAAGVGLFMVAPMAVPVLFGPNWDGAIVPLQALALYAAARSLGAGAVDVYRGIGRPGIGLTIALIRLALLVPALLIAAHEGGIDAVAWTQAALALAFAAGMQFVAARVVGIAARDLVAALRPAAALAGGVALGAGAIRWGVDAADGAKLLVAAIAGAAGGMIALWRFDAGFLRDTRALLATARVPS
jgi:lipopolysaccharide exporter